MILSCSVEEDPWPGFVNLSGGSSSTDVGIFNFWDVMIGCHNLCYDERPSGNFFIKYDVVPGEPYSPTEDERKELFFRALVRYGLVVPGL